MVEMPNARGQDMHVAVSSPVHGLDILDYVHSIFAAIIKASDKRRYIDRLPGSLGSGIDRGGLFLRKAQGHVDSDSFTHRHLRRAEAFPGAGIFDVGIGYP